MMGLSKWKVALYLAGIFLAGSVSGWVIASKTAKQKVYTAPRSEEIAASLRASMHSRLALSEDQKKQINAVIERTSKEMQSIHKDWSERIRQTVSNRNAQFAAILTPEQQKQFEQIEKERRESWRGTNSWPGRRGPREGHRGPRERGATNGPGSTNNATGPNF